MSGDGEHAAGSSTGDAVFVSDGAAGSGGASGGREEALRQRAAEALERAYGFVTAHAGELAGLRARVILEVEPPEALEVRLAQEHARDPGLASLPLDGPVARALVGRGDEALAGPLAALEVLADHGHTRAPVATALVGALAAGQRDDGSFGAAPGPAERLATTGLVGGHLARSLHVRPEPIVMVGDFLAAHFTPDRVETEPWLELLGAAHYFSNTHHPFADEALQWCGRALEKGFRSGRIEAVTVTRILRTCESDALPGAALRPDELLLALLDEQASDGGFAALEPEGPPGRVGATVDALAALIALARTLE